MEISNIAAICPRLQQQNRRNIFCKPVHESNWTERNVYATGLTSKIEINQAETHETNSAPEISSSNPVTFRENPSQISAKETDGEEKRNVLDVKQTNIRGKALINSLFIYLNYFPWTLYWKIECSPYQGYLGMYTKKLMVYHGHFELLTYQVGFQPCKRLGFPCSSCFGLLQGGACNAGTRSPSRKRRKEVLFPGKQKGYKQYVRIYNYVYV